MKMFLSVLFFFVFSLPAMAQKIPDGKSGFASSEACLTAVRSGYAQAYVPVSNRAPGSGYTQMSMAEAGYVNGACAQGLTVFVTNAWVYLPPTFQVGKRGETLVMWKCGNSITGFAAVPMDQVITRMAPATSFTTAPQACTATQERCEMITWCDQNKGWETRTINGITEQFCAVPSISRHVARVTTTTVEDKHVIVPVQTVEVRPVQVATPVNVDFPNAQIKVRGGGVDVSGTQCRFDCIGREVVKSIPGFQDIVSSNKQCEIRFAAEYVSEQEAKQSANGRTVTQNNVTKKWQVNGRLLLDRNPGDQNSADIGKILITEVVGNSFRLSKSVGKHVSDCNVNQSDLKTNWTSVVKHMGLPPTCKPN